MNRKDDHIREALSQNHPTNDFDLIRFVPSSLTSKNVHEVDLKTTFFGHTFQAPIYINAMTGGSEQATQINQRLAEIAKACGLMIASGSVSAALKDPFWEESFRILRSTNPDGCILANIGLSQNLDGAKKAIELLQANGLQIHLNAPQEIVMPEGDRDFSHWRTRLQEIIQQVNVPVIVKEVGFGMSTETANELQSMGVQWIDVGGKGGTNFIEVENSRRPLPMNDFVDYGFSTVESLLDLHGKHSLTVFASGGVRGAYDIVKSLYLGADMVGLSGYFLKLVHQHSVSECIEIINQLIQDVKGIFAVLDVNNLQELRSKKVIYDSKLNQFMKQRGIKR